MPDGILRWTTGGALPLMREWWAHGNPLMDR